MDDVAYDDLVSRFGEGERKVTAELATEAQRRADQRVLAAIELRNGPSAKEARASGDLLALGRAIAGRAGLWHTWGPLVEEVSRWPDTDAARSAAEALARALDPLDHDDLREAPPAWWNAAQRGEVVVGWPLVRRLNFHQPTEALVPCAVAASLAELTSIEADEAHLAVEHLRAARRLRELSYEFASNVDRPSEPIEALAVLGTVERLTIAIQRAADLAPLRALARLRELSYEFASSVDRPSEPIEALAVLGTVERLTIAIQRAADLAPLRALARLRELKIELRCEAVTGGDPLAPLAGMSLSSLRVASRSALPSLAVLDKLPELRVLHVDRAPADPAPIGRLTKLEELMLGHAGVVPGLPASLRTLHMIDCDGLRSSEPFAPLRALDVLRMTDCRALRSLDVSALSLRELAIGGSDRLERIDLGAAAQLVELRLDGLPALRELHLAGGRPASLRLVEIERCPALVVPAGLG
jgi:hypothetical protein